MGLSNLGLINWIRFEGPKTMVVYLDILEAFRKKRKNGLNFCVSQFIVFCFMPKRWQLLATKNFVVKCKFWRRFFFLPRIKHFGDGFFFFRLKTTELEKLFSLCCCLDSTSRPPVSKLTLPPLHHSPFNW